MELFDEAQKLTSNACVRAPPPRGEPLLPVLPQQQPPRLRGRAGGLRLRRATHTLRPCLHRLRGPLRTSRGRIPGLRVPCRRRRHRVRVPVVVGRCSLRRRGRLLGVPRHALLHDLRPLSDVFINLPTKCSTERLANISPTSEDRALQQRLLEFLAARPEWRRTARYEDRSTLHYFQGALYRKDGIEQATQADAASFFAMSALSRVDLKQVWAIADAMQQGYLGSAEFVTAMQLVSLAQAGNEITQDSLKREDLSTLYPPVMEGVDELLGSSKAVVKRVHPDDNGTT